MKYRGYEITLETFSIMCQDGELTIYRIEAVSELKNISSNDEDDLIMAFSRIIKLIDDDYNIKYLK